MEPDEILELRHEVRAGRTSKLEKQLAELPEEFVIKPVEGYHGDGVEFFQRKGVHLSSLSGDEVGFSDFVECLETASRVKSVSSVNSNHGQSIMFQKMGRAHSAIARLSGRYVMQSVRICTFLGARGCPELLFGFLKVIAGKGTIDNFRGGKSGNIIAAVDQRFGRVTRAIRFDSALGASRPTYRHPQTGEVLLGFEVPDWRDACALALRAARNFSGTRAVGWDIGLTDAGPVLLEGNATWDPVSPFYRPVPTAAEFRME